MGSPRGVSGKEPSCQFRRHNRCSCDPWVRKIPWRREWLPTPIFLPGELHGQRSLVDYSPWGCTQSNTTERLTVSLHFTGDINTTLHFSLGEKNGMVCTWKLQEIHFLSFFFLLLIISYFLFFLFLLYFTLQYCIGFAIH